MATKMWERKITEQNKVSTLSNIGQVPDSHHLAHALMIWNRIESSTCFFICAPGIVVSGRVLRAEMEEARLEGCGDRGGCAR